MSYANCQSYCNKWGIETTYSDVTKNYIVFSYLAKGSPNLDAKLAAVEYNSNNANIYIWDDASGYTADISAYVLVVPTAKNIKNINIITVYTNDEFENIQKYNTPYDLSDVSIEDKSIIYLYPTEETEVTVKLGKSEKVTCSYPKYTSSGWKVIASPDGSLVDTKSGKNLYSLYWEGISNIDVNKTEEFIVYWLPKLEENKYNFIRFETIDKINEDMPLEITPEPDTVIRVWMEYEGLENPIEVEEQKLETPERKGFIVVECGGTEIK